MARNDDPPFDAPFIESGLGDIYSLFIPIVSVAVIVGITINYLSSFKTVFDKGDVRPIFASIIDINTVDFYYFASVVFLLIAILLVRFYIKIITIVKDILQEKITVLNAFESIYRISDWKSIIFRGFIIFLFLLTYFLAQNAVEIGKGIEGRVSNLSTLIFFVFLTAILFLIEIPMIILKKKSNVLKPKIDDHMGSMI
jgi:hypothetical protein